MSERPKAVVLLSGGLDSTTCLAIAKADGFDPYCLSFRYGQRHEAELEAARSIAKQLAAAAHVVAEIDLRVFGGSALTSDIPVPKGRSDDQMTSGIPVTYVPARNTVFLSFALAWADVLECTDIFIGVNALDYSGYPDCRPDYIDAFAEMANKGTRLGANGQTIKIHAPLIHMSKADIVRRGLELDVPYSLTRTCYDPDDRGAACGECDACLLRQKGFRANCVTDPAPYQRRIDENA